jgi:hypothetical protein
VSTNPVDHLTNILKDWEAEYQAARPRLNLQDIHALRALVARIATIVERDATGPSSSPVIVPDTKS